MDLFENENKNEKKRKSKKIVLIIILIALIVIGCVIAFVLISNANSNQSGTKVQGENGKGLAFEENQEKKNVLIKSVTMPGWDRIDIAANTKNVVVDFYNPEENKDNFYLTYELYLEDTGEVLYKSGLIKPGDHVREITLSRALSPGTYKAVIHIQPYTADENLTAKNDALVHVNLVAA